MHVGPRLPALLAAAALAACSPSPARAETALDAFLDGERLLKDARSKAQAMAAFERAVALDPDFAPPRYYLCSIYSGAQEGAPWDPERAVAEGEALLRLNFRPSSTMERVPG